MKNNKVFIITEGSEKTGFGHVTRCLSLYQAFEEKGIKPKFVINGEDSILNILRNTRYEMFNWSENQDRLFKMIENADMAIIDSYLADLVIYEKISKLVKKPVYYDDNNRLEYPCGIVVNGNIHAKELNYPENECVKYLLGKEYLPLRKEFWDVPDKEIKKEINSILITFGGDDFRNMTPKILKFLNTEFKNIKKEVVIGKGFKNLDSIKKEMDKNTNLNYYPDANMMKNLMLNCDIAISAGGQTLYELACCGIPSISIAIAENQLGNVKGFERLGIIKYAGCWEDIGKIYENLNIIINELQEYEVRKKISKKMKKIISGQGSKKIIKKIKELL